MSGQVLSYVMILANLSETESIELSEILEEKARAHYAAVSLYRRAKALQPVVVETTGEPVYHAEGFAITGCPDCDAARFVDRDPRPCELHRAPEEPAACQVEACPVTQRTGEVDPWDLPADELNPDFVPVEPTRYVADRSAYDPHDDRADIVPFERGTFYPWLPK